MYAGFYVRRPTSPARGRFRVADKFKGLMIRRGRKRAIFAISHKSLNAVLLLIERSDYYRDAETDYKALAVQ
jgi:transposase